MNIRTAVIKANVNAIGELLIRAGAHMGNLTEEEQKHLELTTGLPSLIRAAFQGVSKVSESAQYSLKRHPPKGFDLS